MDTYIVEWIETQDVVVQVVVEATNEQEAIDIARESGNEKVIDTLSSCNKRDYEATLERNNMNNKIGHLCSKCKRYLTHDTIKLDSNGNETCAYCGNILKYSGAYAESNITPEDEYEMFS